MLQTMMADAAKDAILTGPRSMHGLVSQGYLPDKRFDFGPDNL